MFNGDRHAYAQCRLKDQHFNASDACAEIAEKRIGCILLNSMALYHVATPQNHGHVPLHVAFYPVVLIALALQPINKHAKSCCHVVGDLLGTRHSCVYLGPWRLWPSSPHQVGPPPSVASWHSQTGEVKQTSKLRIMSSECANLNLPGRRSTFHPRIPLKYSANSKIGYSPWCDKSWGTWPRYMIKAW